MSDNPSVNHAVKIKLMIDAAYAEMDMAALPISLKEEVCSFLETASSIIKRWAVDIEDGTGFPSPPIVDEPPPPIIEDPTPSEVN